MSEEDLAPKYLVDLGLRREQVLPAAVFRGNFYGNVLACLGYVIRRVVRYICEIGCDDCGDPYVDAERR